LISMQAGTDTQINVTQSSFINNVALSQNGGGLFVSNFPFAHLHGNTASGNIANGRGDAVFVNSTSVSMANDLSGEDNEERAIASEQSTSLRRRALNFYNQKAALKSGKNQDLLVGIAVGLGVGMILVAIVTAFLIWRRKNINSRYEVYWTENQN